MAEMFNPSQSLALQNPDVLELNRQRKLADLLISQGSQTPQGQTVSGGVYVPPNPMEYLGNLFNVYAGTKANEKLDAKEITLAQKLRDLGATETQDILGTAQGTPEKVTELAGPAYKGVAPTAVMPAQEGNLQSALAKALTAQSPQAQSLVAPLMKNALPEATTLEKEYKAAKSQGYTGNINDFKNQMNEYQKAELGIQKQRLALEGANANKGQIVETPQGVMLINPHTGQATAVTANGEPVLGKGNLTESQGKAAVFHSQMVSAQNELNNVYAKGFNPNSATSQATTSMAGGVFNALTPSSAQQAKQAQNQWTEAYLRFKTGAGTNAHEIEANRQTYFPQIGDSPDVVAQKARMREQAQNDISMAAGPQGGRMGAQPITKTTQSQPVVQKAYIGSEPIVVKNGKWVYENTGKAVE